MLLIGNELKNGYFRPMHARAPAYFYSENNVKRNPFLTSAER